MADLKKIAPEFPGGRLAACGLRRSGSWETLSVSSFAALDKEKN
jgi:hypothetical protein